MTAFDRLSANVREKRLSSPVGTGMVGLASFGLATAWLTLGNSQAPEIANGAAASVLLLIVAVGSLLAIPFPERASSWLGPDLLWSALGLSGIGQFVNSPGMISAVEPAEAMTILLAIATIGAVGKHPIATRMAIAIAAAMLSLFGLIHLAQAEALSKMVPGWMPLRDRIPYLTGSLMIVAALAFGWSRVRPQAAKLVAVMFLSWLPLVHLDRLMRNPASFDEWRFALTALALAGALLLIALGGTADGSRKGPPPR